MSDTGSQQPTGGISRQLLQAISLDHTDCVVDWPTLNPADLADLKRTLRGESTVRIPIDKARAIRALVRSDRSPETSEIVANIVSRTAETSRVRAVAAFSLGSIPSAVSEKALLRNLTTEGEVVRAEVIKALGRIGSAEVLDGLNALPDPQNDLARKQLSFAKLAIAFRAGSRERDAQEARRSLGVPDLDVTPSPGVRHRTFESSAVEAAEIRQLLDTVDGSTYGVTLNPEIGFRVPCGRATYVLFLNRLLKRGAFVESVRSRSMIAGILAAQEQGTRRLTPRYLVLTTSAANGLDLLVMRTDGDPAFVGEAVSEGDAFRLKMRGVGARSIPSEIDGLLSRTEIKWSLSLSSESRHKRHGEPIQA